MSKLPLFLTLFFIGVGTLAQIYIPVHMTVLFILAIVVIPAVSIGVYNISVINKDKYYAVCCFLAGTGTALLLPAATLIPETLLNKALMFVVFSVFVLPSGYFNIKASLQLWNRFREQEQHP